jgi:hypothetical protein
MKRQFARRSRTRFALRRARNHSQALHLPTSRPRARMPDAHATCGGFPWFRRTIQVIRHPHGFPPSPPAPTRAPRRLHGFTEVIPGGACATLAHAYDAPSRSKLAVQSTRLVVPMVSVRESQALKLAASRIILETPLARQAWNGALRAPTKARPYRADTSPKAFGASIGPVRPAHDA